MQCSILSFASYWWTIAGLLIDMLGVTIVSWRLFQDLTRDLRVIFYRRAALAALHLRPTELHWTPEEVVDSEDGLPSYEIKSLDERAAHALVRWAWFRIRLADFRHLGRWFEAEPDFEDMATTFEDTASDIQRGEMKPGPYWLGLFLLYFGFTLQIIGAWPC